jgi:hypothetical protein
MYRLNNVTRRAADRPGAWRVPANCQKLTAKSCSYLAGVAAGLATLVAAGLLVLLATVLVLFLVPFLVAFFAVLLVLAGVAAGVAALVAWAANVRGIVATARAIVANKVFVIFFSPRAIARLQSHLAPDGLFTR